MWNPCEQIHVNPCEIHVKSTWTNPCKVHVKSMWNPCEQIRVKSMWNPCQVDWNPSARITAKLLPTPCRRIRWRSVEACMVAIHQQRWKRKIHKRNILMNTWGFKDSSTTTTWCQWWPDKMGPWWNCLRTFSQHRCSGGRSFCHYWANSSWLRIAAWWAYACSI